MVKAPSMRYCTPSQSLQCQVKLRHTNTSKTYLPFVHIVQKQLGRYFNVKDVWDKKIFVSSLAVFCLEAFAVCFWEVLEHKQKTGGTRHGREVIISVSVVVEGEIANLAGKTYTSFTAERPARIRPRGALPQTQMVYNTHQEDLTSWRSPADGLVLTDLLYVSNIPTTGIQTWSTDWFVKKKRCCEGTTVTESCLHCKNVKELMSLFLSF